jgi:hypothetical protein
VLEGRHKHLGREVAIKQAPRTLTDNPAVRKRFTAEARLLASLDHPHIVPIYDFVEHDGLCLLIMEKLPAGMLWDRFPDGIDDRRACALTLAICSGLQAAHARGVLHRDIKPENIMFSATDVLKVTDFGVAKMVSQRSTVVTKAGEVVGTPAYMAPEQARGEPLTPATDVYAVAMVLYEMLARDLPFPEDGDPMALLFRHAFEQPCPLTDKAPAVSPVIANVVMAGLATDPGARPRSAESFALLLARACTSLWGSGWLASSEVQVLGSDDIVAATERPRSSLGAVTAGHTGGWRAQPVHVIVDDVATAGPTPRRAPTDSPDPSQPKAAVAISKPYRPRAEAASAIVLSIALLLVAVAVALFAVRPPPKSGDLRPGWLTIGAADPAAGSVRLDLSKPLVVWTSASGPRADTVTLAFDLLGQRAFEQSAPLVQGLFGGTAAIDAERSRFLITGTAEATVSLSRQGRVVAYREFRLRDRRPVPATAPEAIIFALGLVIVVSGERLLHRIRHRSRAGVATVGMLLAGAVAGVATTGAVWLFTDGEPAAWSVGLSVLLGMTAGLIMARTARRAGPDGPPRRKTGKLVSPKRAKDQSPPIVRTSWPERSRDRRSRTTLG